MSIKLTKVFTQRPHTFIGLLIFATCSFVYLSSKQIGNGDTLPNSVLAFNWITQNTLTFDNFNTENFKYPDGSFRWYFVQAPNGHVSSTYPIGAAIVTFPLYLLFSLYLKIIGFLQTGIFSFPPHLANIISPEFNQQRVFFQKLAASITTAFSVVIFYNAARIKFSTATALIGTFTFAFATSTWVTSSQALWQHTVSNLLLISLILCFLKINRTEDSSSKALLIVAGILGGLLPGTRPPSILFLIAIIVYALFAYRKRAIFLFLGLFSALLSIGWNFYYFGFGNLVGGYNRQFATNNSSYHFTFSQFFKAFTGLLVSPSRGALIFAPVLAFSGIGAVQVFRQRQHKDEQLFACLTIATVLTFLQYCFHHPWYGDAAENYGSRFLAELLPVLCYLLCYFISRQIEIFSAHRFKSGILILFTLCLFWSTFVQTVGAFGEIRSWERVPYPHPTRLWDWHDNEIRRTMNSVLFQLNDPIGKPKRYLKKTAGTIEGLQDQLGQPIISPLIVPVSKRRQILKAALKNTGTVQWFGYETGIRKGRIEVELHFFDQNNQPVQTRRFELYLSGNAKPEEVGTAVGLIEFPEAPGNYSCTCDLVAYDVGSLPKQASQNCKLNVKVTAETDNNEVPAS